MEFLRNSVLGPLGSAVSNFLLTPTFLWFLALIPVVILMYLLKLRRTEMIIPSTMLWKKSLQDLTANAPFQKLKKNLLLFLQILVILLIVAALTRPFIKTQGVSGNNLCILIDRSASMLTREGEETRLDQARKKALELIDQMSKEDKTMIVTFAENSDVLCELTGDLYKLRTAINSIQGSHCRTRIRDAITVAHSLQQLSVPDLKLVIISDGDIIDLQDVRTRALDPVFLQVGETSRNLGITTFSVREPYEGQGERQALIQIHNDDKVEASTTLTLYFDDATLSVNEVTVAPGEDEEVVFSLPEMATGTLRVEIDAEDALDVDNKAWLAIRPSALVKVLIVSQGDSVGAYFIKRVLSLDSRVQASSVAPVDFVPTGDYDLTIFESFVPSSSLELPLGTLLFIDSVPPVAGLILDGSLQNPPVIAKDPEHPLMRFLSPENVSIQRARKLTLPEGARPLLSTTGAPLVADISRGMQKIALITFNIGGTNWPLRLSFPLFFQNLVTWAAGETLEQGVSVRAGTPLSLPAFPQGGEAIITKPDGTTETIGLDPLRPIFYGATEQTGSYVAVWGGKRGHFAVNLLDREESSILPAEKLSVGRAEVRAERSVVKQIREFWRWLILAALAFLTLEWWVYSRRAWL